MMQKRLGLQAQIEALQAELLASEQNLAEVGREDETRERQIKQDRNEIAKRRGAN